MSQKYFVLNQEITGGENPQKQHSLFKPTILWLSTAVDIWEGLGWFFERG